MTARAAAISASLGHLRSDCEAIMNVASHITIDTVALAAFAETIDINEVVGKAPSTSPGAPIDIALVSHTLACNAINYCYYPLPRTDSRWFWSNPDDETVHGQDDEANGVTAAITYSSDRGMAQLSNASWLSANSTPELLGQVFRPAAGAGTLPMLKERAGCWADLGRGLETFEALAVASTQAECGADAIAGAGAGVRGLLLASGWPQKPSAVSFVGWLCAACPCWHDTRKYRSTGGGSSNTEAFEVEAAFLKRAQLCASILNATGAVQWYDMDELTVFSDYRLPQLFRARGIMILDPTLHAHIEAGELVTEGGAEEVEIRAGTVHISELLVAHLHRRLRGGNSDSNKQGGAGTGAGVLTTAKLDYYLWKTAVAEDAAGILPEFHRTRTISY